MKTLLLCSFLLAAIGGNVMGNSENTLSFKSTYSANVVSDNITLINDTPNAIKVHTGSGEVTLNPKGGKTSFSCNPGKQIKFDGKVAFKVTEDMCGTTIKLSQYLK
jgi:hypothetical protein